MNMRDLERQLWAAADKLRGNISSSDYKYVVLGLIFLKYVSDAFLARYQAAVDENYDPEDRDWYLAENVFWIPKGGSLGAPGGECQTARNWRTS